MTLMKLVICCSVTLGLATVCVAKEWRGIVPLRSTRADVERLLGTPTQALRDVYYYRLRQELAVIWFQGGPCDGCRRGWHASPDTVTAIGVIPRANRALQPQDLQGVEAERGQGDLMYYSNYEEGVTIESLKGRVTLLSYRPRKDFADRACQIEKYCVFETNTLVDEYSLLPWEDERARLGDYALRLKATMERGAIVFAGPGEAQRTKMMKHAVRVRKHLVTLGLEPQRILILDGGYQEIPLFDLHCYGIGGVEQRIWYFPRQENASKPSAKKTTKTKLP